MKEPVQRNPDKVFVGAHLPAPLTQALDKYSLASGMRNRSHGIETLLSNSLKELGYFLPTGVKHRKGAK